MVVCFGSKTLAGHIEAFMHADQIGRLLLPLYKKNRGINVIFGDEISDI